MIIDSGLLFGASPHEAYM